ncbi:MAG: SpoIID/LytB domain-containing protein [Phycisphaerales bacterium JB039]
MRCSDITRTTRRIIAHELAPRTRIVWLGALCAAVLVTTVACELADWQTAYRSPAPVPILSEPNMRVRVRRALEQAEISGARRIMLVAGEQRALLNAPVVATAAGGGVTFTDAIGQRVTVPASRDAELVPADPRVGPAPEPALELDGARFPGRLRFLATGPRLDVINLVPLETYVAGVISKELYSSWQLDAYCVQAVTARSYALHERARAMAEDRSYDVENTTADQVYGGVNTLAVAEQATEETRGHVMRRHGQILRTYYSSTCGGRAASAADTWPTGPGYEFNRVDSIQGHDRPHACDFSPLYRWDVLRSSHDINERVLGWARATSQDAGAPLRGFTELRAIEVARRNATGRPAAYRLTDRSGLTATISAEQLRLALNYATPAYPAPQRESLVRSGDIEVMFRPGEVFIAGRGFGHGVGMCQFCAEGFARRGMDWRRMLTMFYPRAEIERLY